MPNPARDTLAGRVYNDLRNLARRTGRGTDEILVGYVLERFLFRMAASTDGGEHFVLKGGLLLARFGARRATRDIDILGRGFPAGEEEIIRRVRRIAGLHIDDGVVFDIDETRSVPIREDEEYNGLRLAMPASVARARLKLQLDISFGDPITPAPEWIDYPQTLDSEPFRLLGYPIETVVAEKLSTAIALGGTNTRDRDYADLWRLLTLHDLDGRRMVEALTATAAHRGIRLRRLSEGVGDLAIRRQSSYTAWRRRRSGAESAHPEDFAEVVAAVTAFADPLSLGRVQESRWSSARQNWEPV